LRQGNADYDNKRQALYEYYQILQEDLLLVIRGWGETRESDAER
jgi:hypothetical protein